MDDREIMQMALDALEDSVPSGWSTNTVNKHQGAIEALRAALAQPNDFSPDWDAMAVMVEEQQRMAKRIEELEAQLEQPEQEPVGNTLTFMTRAIFNIVADHQEINGGYFIADGDVAAFVDRLAKVINSTFEPLKEKNND